MPVWLADCQIGTYIVFMARTTTATEAVAAEIRAELARQRLGVQWLADTIGVERSNLHRKIHGGRTLTIDDAVACAVALDIPLSRMFSETAAAA